MRPEPVVVRSHRVPVPSLPADLDRITIAHISDLHLRRWNPVFAHARRLLGTLEFELLALTGDVCRRPGSWTRTLPLLERLLELVPDDVPMFAVTGNHDGGAPAEPRICRPHFLMDEAATVELDAGRLRVAGLAQPHPDAGAPESVLPNPASADVTLLLTHYPSTVYRVPPGRVALQLSGHTHAGQIRLPWLGCIFNHDRLPLAASHGLHRLNGTWVHVTAGLGAGGPFPVRINCPPEIALLTLTSDR